MRLHGHAIRPDLQESRNETYVAEGRISLAVAEATISMAREEKRWDRDKEVCVDRERDVLSNAAVLRSMKIYAWGKTRQSRSQAPHISS